MERERMLFLNAPAGSGKSTMAFQLGSHFVAGKETIGFCPNGIEKVLLIQDEDSEQDISIMRDRVLQHFSDSEKK